MSIDKRSTAPQIEKQELSEEDISLLDAAYAFDLPSVEKALEEGANVNARHPENAMTALHLAIINGHYRMTKLLGDHGADFVQDGFGRWPTTLVTLATVITVKEELWEYVEAQEEAQIQENAPVEVDSKRSLAEDTEDQ